MAALSCPRVGWKRTGKESEFDLLTLISHLHLSSPLFNSPRSRNTCSPQNAPSNQTRAPALFLFRVPPSIAPQSRPSPVSNTLTNPKPNALLGLPSCQTTLNCPLRLLTVSTTIWILSRLLGKWEQNAHKWAPRCLPCFAFFLSFHLRLVTVFPPFPLFSPSRILLPPSVVIPS